jgi:hypothetical protein
LEQPKHFKELRLVLSDSGHGPVAGFSEHGYKFLIRSIKDGVS